jgi:TRAP-type C4-dicarboxylate transport system permease small subunit
VSSSEGRVPPTQYDELGSPKTGGPARSWFGSLTAVLNVAGTILIIAMAIAVNADVFGRNALNQPIAGVNEFVGLSIVAVVFLQMANTLREGRHVSNDIIVLAICASYPRVARLCYGLFHLIGAYLMLLIVWFVSPMFLEMYQRGYYQGTAGVIEIPIWPFVLPVIVGGVVSAIQYIVLAGQEFALAFGRKGMPE